MFDDYGITKLTHGLALPGHLGSPLSEDPAYVSPVVDTLKELQHPPSPPARHIAKRLGDRINSLSSPQQFQLYVKKRPFRSCLKPRAPRVRSGRWRPGPASPAVADLTAGYAFLRLHF